jgi:predicted DNA-binding transcriptional regulator
MQPFAKTPTHRLEAEALLDILRDSRLAWSHKAILTYLCHLPADVEVTVPEIEKQLPVSHQTVYAAVTRLLNLHLVRRRVTEHATSLTHVSVLFSAAPDFREKLSSGIAGKEEESNNEDDQHRAMPIAGRATGDTGVLCQST